MRDTLSGYRVLLMAAEVPFQNAAIKRVVQDTCATLILAEDRCVEPFASFGASNAILV